MQSLNTTLNHAIHPSPRCPRVSAITRRLGVSPSVARAYADHAFGVGERSDVAHLAACTAARIAEARP